VLRRRRRGTKPIDNAGHAPHPEAPFTRQTVLRDTCTLDGERFRETVVRETTITPTVEPHTLHRPLPPRAIVALPPTVQSSVDLVGRGNGSTVTPDLVDLRNGSTVTPLDTRPVCACSTGLAPGEACFVCEVAACRDCGDLVEGTLYRFCRGACRNPRPNHIERYDRPPPELLDDYGAAGGAP
jgi:hypothetical protein